MDSGTLRLSAVPSTSGGSFPQLTAPSTQVTAPPQPGHGTFNRGHGTLNKVTAASRSRHPQSGHGTLKAADGSTLGISRTAAREPPTGLQQEGSSQKQDCNKMLD
jgi:hypothetical protein